MPTTTLARATSADARLLADVPARLSRGRVHSVFRRVVNVRTAHPTLISLAVRGVPDAPDTVVTDLDSWDRLGLRPGDEVRARAGRVLLGQGTSVLLADALPWEVDLPSLPASAGRAAWLRELLATEGVRGGMLPAPGDSPALTAWQRAVQEELGRRAQALLHALRTQDEDAVVRSAAALHGLGPGLTPAGDDALVGLALVCAMPGSRLAWAAPALARAVGTGSGTTAVAAAALMHALQGRAVAPVMDLLGALCSDGQDDQLTTLHGRRVLAIGHTSGTDLLVGVSAGLDVDHEMRGDR